jgi:hypothetical protein
MSASEVLANKLESETERPAHRAPPPPPISTQSEPPSPIEIIPTPYEGTFNLSIYLFIFNSSRYHIFIYGTLQ